MCKEVGQREIELQTATAVSAEGQEYAVTMELLKEHRMELWVNGHLAARLVCTPDHLEEYIIGRLITEGFIEDASEVRCLKFGQNDTVCKVVVQKKLKLQEETTEEPTSVLGNQTLLQPKGQKEVGILPQAEWKKEWIFQIVDTFSKDSKLHKTTGGTHSCILAAQDEILYVAEDLGRHNAMDKAIGYAVLNKIPLKECILFTTGRVPVDMVSKVIRAGIPILVSKSVPTVDAVEMAKQYGLTLICRAWPDSFLVCSMV